MLSGAVGKTAKQFSRSIPQCSAQTHLMRCRGAPMCAPAGSPHCHLDQVKRSGTRGEIPQCITQTFSSAKAFSLAEKVGNSPANCSDQGEMSRSDKRVAARLRVCRASDKKRSRFNGCISPFFLLFFRHYKQMSTLQYIRIHEKSFRSGTPSFFFMS